MKSFVCFFITAITVAGGIGLLFWKYILGFIWSLIPPEAHYAWVGKILSLFFVGYIGGVGLPLISFFFIMMMWVAFND